MSYTCRINCVIHIIKKKMKKNRIIFLTFETDQFLFLAM